VQAVAAAQSRIAEFEFRLRAAASFRENCVNSSANDRKKSARKRPWMFQLRRIRGNVQRLVDDLRAVARADRGRRRACLADRQQKRRPKAP
jgi:hypothetical protein